MNLKRYIRKLQKGKGLSVVYALRSAESIIKSSAKLIAVQITAAILLFGNNYIIIKMGGDQVYGHYVSLMAWVNFFSVIVVFGFDDYFIAAIPKMYFNHETKDNVLSVLFRSAVILVTVFCLLIIVLAMLMHGDFFEPALRQNQFYFYTLILEASVLTTLVAFFAGINKLVFAQAVDKLLRPGLIILFSVLVFVVVKRIDLRLILLMQIIVLLAAIAFMCIQLKKEAFTFRRSGIFNISLKVNAAFLLISILNLLSVRLDILFLTKTVLPEQVGYYNIGVRMADIIGFPLSAMNLVVPIFLSKENTANSLNIKKTIRNTSLIAFAGILIVYLPAVLLGRFVLPLFGKNFIQGYWPMVILGGTYLISSVSHQMTGYLMVSGHQNKSLACLIINVLSVLIFCRVLIPSYGLAGAATSVLLGSAVYFIATVVVYKKAVTELN